MLHFFLSYARVNDANHDLVKRFFTDLRDEVEVQTGLHAPIEVGFLAPHSIELGALWTDDLAKAVSTCRVFVAICAPGYFNSQYCGKEWHIFARRLTAYQQANGHAAPALLPLRWLPASVPPIARPYQNNHPSLGTKYDSLGLRALVQRPRHFDDYCEFVEALAVRIVKVADDHELPPYPQSVTDFDEVPNDFEQ